MTIAIDPGDVFPAVSTYPKTVLIVEDDADCREELEIALSRAGYGVVTAADGREALQRLRTTFPRPSLILLDWMMPGMDGMTFLSHQASDPRYAAIPVVVVSAVASMARIPTLCVAAVVGKPVRARTLIEICDRMCGESGRGGGGDGGDGGTVIGASRGAGGSATAPPAKQETCGSHGRTSPQSGGARRAATAHACARAGTVTRRRRCDAPSE